MTAFRITAQDGEARTGELTTLHGTVRTPAFMPVGTHATVKALDPDEVRSSGADIVLCNAYHLVLRPGVEVIERAGGLHRFMGWDAAILTDSGGYQLLSLREVAQVDDDGAVFISPYDGSRLRVTPEEAVDLQRRLGSDVIMCLDHPVPWGSDDVAVTAAMQRTHLWAQRSRAVHPRGGQLLFGIAQGGFEVRRRSESAACIDSMQFDGNAIGGLSVGEPLPVMEDMAAASLSQLDSRKPRYFMGLGTDRELLAMVGLGVDMFDCVAPTRLARNGTALTPRGHLSLRRSAMRDDLGPIDGTCVCAACRRFSRAYLRHLFKAAEILAHRLVSLHNLTHLGRLMDQARTAITEGRFTALRRDVEAAQEGGGATGPR